MSTISERDILNRRVRGESLYRIYSYIKERELVPYKQVVDDFSMVSSESKRSELTEEVLGFLSVIGLIGGTENLKVEKPVKNELDFKIEILGAIHKHNDIYVSQFSKIIREVYKLGQKVGNREYSIPLGRLEERLASLMRP